MSNIIRFDAMVVGFALRDPDGTYVLTQVWPTRGQADSMASSLGLIHDKKYTVEPLFAIPDNVSVTFHEGVTSLSRV